MRQQSICMCGQTSQRPLPESAKPPSPCHGTLVSRLKKSDDSHYGVISLVVTTGPWQGIHFKQLWRDLGVWPPLNCNQRCFNWPRAMPTKWTPEPRRGALENSEVPATAARLALLSGVTPVVICPLTNLKKNWKKNPASVQWQDHWTTAPRVQDGGPFTSTKVLASSY